jgi:glycosyltransferase involved in cell wall biosynthesis
VYQQAMQLGISKRDLIHTIRFRRIEVWITLLSYLYNQISERTRMDMNRVHEIPLGIDLSKIDKGLTKISSRGSFKLPPEGCLLGVIGRFDPLKGQLFVIGALRKLHDLGIRAHLLLVGESTRGEGQDYEKQLVGLTKQLGLDQFVHIRPFIEDVERFYAAVDVCVVPSAGETFGMVTIEAMSAGCAVIGTNTSGTPEILGHGEYGMVYTPNDLDEFVKKAVRLCKDERLRTAFGLKAAQVVKEKYDLAKVMDATEELLLQEIEKKNK